MRYIIIYFQFNFIFSEKTAMLRYINMNRQHMGQPPLTLMDLPTIGLMKDSYEAGREFAQDLIAVFNGKYWPP
jgi:hypothetical protein